ncbi:MAG TPA: hypothetical protein VGC66_17000 [Pyrinomonadaceae bacterium]|jgi:uncharacterized membrane protein
MSNHRPSQSLRDYTSLPVEIIVVSLSVLPVLLLIYFYPMLPERIPVFLNLHGDVEVWATKSVASVFRVPAMALDLQAICLLMKYGTVQAKSGLPNGNVAEYLQYQRRADALSAGLWDWLRSFNAVKMCAESLDILFMSDERLHFLRTAGWVVTWLAVILAIAGALFYGYRLMVVKRAMREAFAKADVAKEADPVHVRGKIDYKPKDAAAFVGRYLLNFANKRAYALAACLVAYPLLVFWPLWSR